MTIGNTLALVRGARAGGYAIPAVNIVDELSIRAVIAAAEAWRSPVIVQTSVKTVRLLGARPLGLVARALAQDATVPVALHLDHCPDRHVITEAIANGWSSVLFDASDRPLDVARTETAEVVAEAHAAGVAVESELENIVGVEDGVGSDEAVHAYTVEQLVEVAHETGADMLAPQLGTAHGLYEAAPELRFDRVSEVARLTDLPVVLHGGTGLSAADFDRFINRGVSKINISTSLKHSYMRSALAHLRECERSDRWEPVKLFADVSRAVQSDIEHHIDMFGSKGRAGEEG